jgi:hypothetical protein
MISLASATSAIVNLRHALTSLKATLKNLASATQGRCIPVELPLIATNPFAMLTGINLLVALAVLRRSPRMTWSLFTTKEDEKIVFC